MPLDSIRSFLKLQSAGGIILVAAAGLAIVAANSPAADLYIRMLEVPFGISLGDFALQKPLLLWINDFLMAIFFLLVGLELKREILDGELSNVRQIALPGIAAIGGVIVPAAIFAALNFRDETAIRGWAIPAATDIAFALGVLALVGSRVPLSLKVFLTTLAVLDDLAAILIIAIFYTADLSWTAHALAGLFTIVLIVMNLLGVKRLGPYFVVGAALWVCVLKSGVHATIAGVLLGLTIPLRSTDKFGHSPARHLEHLLHPWVAFGILPVFAFANAGVSLAGFEIGKLFATVPLGIALGLLVGKQIGVFGAAWLAIKFGLAKMPQGANWISIYGVALLCGIGFTMSLFIGGLAYEGHGAEYAVDVRLGVIGGSLLAAIAGFIVLRIGLPRPGEPSLFGDAEQSVSDEAGDEKNSPQ